MRRVKLKRNYLTEAEKEELKRWESYLSYDELLIKKADLEIEIEDLMEVKMVTELRADRVKSLTGALTTIIDVAVGYTLANMYFYGFSFWKAPNYWIFTLLIGLGYLLVALVMSKFTRK